MKLSSPQRSVCLFSLFSNENKETLLSLFGNKHQSVSIFLLRLQILPKIYVVHLYGQKIIIPVCWNDIIRCKQAYQFILHLFLWLCFSRLPGLKQEADTSDDNLLLIFQPFNSLICSFQFNLCFFFFFFFFKKKKKKKTLRPLSPLEKWGEKTTQLNT